MAHDFWLSLPVRNIKKSKEFFTALGFQFKPGPGNTDTSAPLTIGSNNTTIMLFEEATFRSCISNEISDTKKGTEVLLSFDAQSKEEVDEMARKAVVAGGTSNHKPYEMKGGMYGCLFRDIDGHSWNVLYMDMTKMPSK